MVSWDVVTNSPVAGRYVCNAAAPEAPDRPSRIYLTARRVWRSAPCTAGQLVNFLETTSKRLRMGVVTAGWRDQAPPTKQPVQEAAESQSSAPTAAAPEPAPTPVPDPAPAPSPEPAALSAATAATAVGTEEAHAGEDDDASRAAASKAKQDQQQPSQQQQPPLQDEDLFYMDEAEAIRQIEKEIEEQIERNHYKALGI